MGDGVAEGSLGEFFGEEYLPQILGITAQKGDEEEVDWGADFDFDEIVIEPSALQLHDQPDELDIDDFLTDDPELHKKEEQNHVTKFDLREFDDLEWPEEEQKNVPQSEIAQLLASMPKHELRTEPTPVSFQVPQKYQLMQPQVQIKSFDKPSPLWSINLNGSPEIGVGWEKVIHHFRDSSDLEGWLGGLAAKHGSAFLPADSSTIIKDTHQRFRRRIRYFEKNIEIAFAEWVRCYLQFCDGFYNDLISQTKLKSSEEVGDEAHGILWTEIFRFFEILQQLEENGSKESADSCSLQQMFTLGISLSVIAPLSVERVREYERIRSFVIGKLKVEGRVLDLSGQFHCRIMDRNMTIQRFGEIMSSMLRNPQSSSSSSSITTSPSIDFDPLISSSSSAAICSLFFQITSSAITRTTETSFRLSPPDCDLVQELSGLLSEADVTSLCTIICAINFCANDISPIDLESMTHEEEDEETETNEDEGSFVDLSSSMLTQDGDSTDDESEPWMEECGSSLDDVLDERRLEDLMKQLTQTDLNSAFRRMAILVHLYPLLSPNNPVKPRVAFSLGKFFRLMIKNMRVAEKLFLEALVLMDIQGENSPSLPLLFGSVGLHCLTGYCDVLLRLEKVSYAIVGTRVCASVLRVQRRIQKYVETLSKIASVAAEHLDRRKAILIYRDLLELYVRQNKINETVYISEVISGIYLDMGKFPQAEAVLLSALNCLSRSRNQSRYYDICAKLAKVYLKSYDYSRGLALLHMMLTRSVSCAKNTLQKLAVDVAQVHAIECHLVGFDMVWIYLTKNSLHRSLEAKILKIKARKAFSEEDYGSALHYIEGSMLKCGPQNMVFLGRLHFFRGNILHQLSLRSRSLSPSLFPLSIYSKDDYNLWEKESSTNESQQTDPQCVFKDRGHLLQDCIQAFSRGYEYFRAAGNDILIGKTVSRIAEVYLDYLFIPVCLQKIPLTSLTRIKKYPPHPTPFTTPPPPPNPSDSPDFDILIDKHIQNPAILGLDISSSCGHLLLLINSLLNIAELRCLQEKKEESLAYWKEAKEMIRLVFSENNNEMFLTASPLPFLGDLLGFYRRLSRCALALEIAPLHLDVFDTFTNLERIYCARRKEGYIRESTLGGPTVAVTSGLTGTVRGEGPETPEAQGFPSEPLSMRTLRNREQNTVLNSTRRETAVSALRKENTLTGPNRRHSQGPYSRHTLTHALQGGGGLSSSPTTSSTLSGPLGASQNASTTSHVDIWSFCHNLPHSAASKEKKSVEKTSVRIWGLLRAIKVSLRDYINGKTTQAETLKCNLQLLHKMQIAAAGSKEVGGDRCSNDRKPSSQMRESNLKSTFKELVTERPSFRYLLYLFHFNEAVVAYVPVSNKYTCLNFLEGKTSPVTGGDHRGVLESTPLTKRFFKRDGAEDTKGKSDWCFLRLFLGGEESAVVSVSQKCTVRSFLRTLCFYEEGAPVSKRESKEDEVIVIDSSGPFTSELRLAMSTVDPTLNPSPLAASTSIFFSSFLGMGTQDEETVSLQLELLGASKTVCISSKYLNTPFLLHFPREIVEKGTSANLLGLRLSIVKSSLNQQGPPTNETKPTSNFTLSPSFLSYMSNLIMGSEVDSVSEIGSEEESWDQIIRASSLILSLFPSDMELNIPSTPASHPYLSPLHFPSFFQTPPTEREKRDTGGGPPRSGSCETLVSMFGDELGGRKSSPGPLLLMCGWHIRIFPWERIFPLPVIRCSSFLLTAKKKALQTASLVPRISCPFIQGMDKHAAINERMKKRSLSKLCVREIWWNPQQTSARENYECFGSLVPFSSPLIQKKGIVKNLLKKYRQFHFLDCTNIGVDFEKLTIGETEWGSSDFPIFLFTFADLADYCSALHYLIRYRPNVTLLFVPASHVKQFSTKFAKVIDIYVKHLTKGLSSRPFYISDRCKFLTSFTHSFQADHGVPVITINGPTPP